MTHVATRTIRVIFNPSSGRKAGLTTNPAEPEDVLSLMDQCGLGSDLIVPESEEAAAEAVREAVAAGIDVVVAAGGDGTVATVATQLIGRRTALGILPYGSVMNIARMLDLPRDPHEAARIIRDGQPRAIDLGTAKGRLFFEAGSVGLNAAIFREAQKLDEQQFRSALRVIWALARYRGARMVLHLDDRVLTTRALVVTVANGPYTGIGFTVAPSARVDDGQFDVRVFRGFSRLGLVAHLCRVAFGRRRYEPKIATYRSSRVQIESRHPLPCRADAHDLGTTPVTFTVIPAALRVVMPT